MSVSQIQSVLLWCTAINYGLLIAWVLIATLARSPWQRLQVRLFHVRAESVDTLNRAGITAVQSERRAGRHRRASADPGQLSVMTHALGFARK